MTTLVAIAGLFVLVFAGVHIAIALGLVAIFLLTFNFQVPVVIVAQTAWSSVDGYALVAIPFFVFAGNLMSRGNIALVILDLVGTLVRAIRGGVALALTFAAVFFAAVNGSSVACAAALGPAATKLLPAEGYDKRFAAAVVAVGGTLGVMIPPSLSFILIGSIVGLPINELFIAGILPGLMEAAMIGAATIIIAKVRGYGGRSQPADWRGFGRQLPAASGALFLPVLIIGTIYAGIFTPTEVSALAALYAVFLVLIVYRSATLGEVWGTLRESVQQTLMIYGVLIGSGLLTALLTRLGVTEELRTILIAAEIDRVTFLIVLNLTLIVVGMFLDGISVIVLLSPIVFPLALVVGIHPIHMAVILTALVEIATITPPVGLNLFVMSRVSGVPLHQIIRAVAPFFAVRAAALVLINAFPWLSLALV
ncbi:TRAP transporter large permease [Acuticoccus sp.]|uniref:TRAP transporter large permease n=1 Tax=Acuticoccus sp. TaxID=1904378 RepID=UPI003B51B35C